MPEHSAVQEEAAAVEEVAAVQEPEQAFVQVYSVHVLIQIKHKKV